MEAFSPLDFLKSILSPTDIQAQNQPNPPSNDNIAPQNSEQQKSVPPVENSTSQNAFTCFIEAHEKRARRIKR
jgi:hypothetical protein